MLNQDTKRKIDSARDILVGKVPDPKAQVEQITTAMIYKFMYDMDASAVEIGGRARFFTGDFKKYSWAQLMDVKLGNQARLELYVESIAKMGKNPKLPQLFRDIFKDAFLPYRNPETLSLFLKEINGFTYDNSEDLGNAFEYLLSIMSAQGDAGQFRTPRHIIDFIVDVVDPKKDETILDPACGTAGFLISAYKHILEDHDGLDNQTGRPTKKEKALTPDQKKKLMNNLVGYDISPDMVKLSLVNMYLHGFPEPKIFEYDTLSSDERWGESFDVMLANPPFMTPKGGIRPHNKFSVQANRSEVLFVDYIMEHLNNKGRAGIIVPEGIIFQSANAYKNLRKLLVEDGLFAVVSLPSGVFNPYSGVKTSILFFDNSVAKKTKHILFAKINNDGFDLGAQRRKLDNDGDLKQVTQTLKSFKEYIGRGKTDNLHVDLFDKELKRSKEKLFSSYNENFTFVSKKFIEEDGDYNLNGEKYRKTLDYSDTEWPLVSLGKLCEILDNKRKPIRKGSRVVGEYPYYGATGVVDLINGYIFNEKLVLIGEDGAKWLSGDKTAFIATGKYWVNNHAHVLRPNREMILDELLVEIINDMDLTSYITGITVPKLNQEKLRSIKIPLPPINIQQKIVDDLGVYHKIIDGAKQVVENYKSSIIIDPEWDIVKLGELAKVGSSKRVFKSEWERKGVPFFRAREIVKLAKDGFVQNELYISEKMFQDYLEKYGAPQRGDLMITGVGTLGVCYLVKKDDRFYFKDGNIIWVKNFSDKVDSRFIGLLYKNEFIKKQIDVNSSGGTVGTYTITNANNTKIPLPTLEVQKEIISRAEEEQKIIDQNKKLIEIFEQKIKYQIDEVFGRNKL
jgi:type I restriction enzyme M protein